MNLLYNKKVLFVITIFIVLFSIDLKGFYVHSNIIETPSDSNKVSRNSINQIRDLMDIEFNSTFYNTAKKSENFIDVNYLEDVTAIYDLAEIPNPGESCEILSALLQNLVTSENGIEKAITLANSINSSKTYNNKFLLGFSITGLFFESENTSYYFSNPSMQFNFILAYLDMFYATNSVMYLNWAQLIFQNANSSFYRTDLIPGFVNMRVTESNGVLIDSLLDHNVFSVSDQVLALQAIRKLQYFSLDQEEYQNYEIQILQLEDLVSNYNYNFLTGGFSLLSEVDMINGSLSSNCYSKDSINYLLYLLGRSEEALNQNNYYYPGVFSDNDDIFALETSQKAFEMIKGINSAFKKNNRIVDNYNSITEEKSDISYVGDNLRFIYASLLYNQLINQYEILADSVIGPTSNSVASDAYRILLETEDSYNEEDGYFYSIWTDETRFSDLTGMGSLITANSWVNIILSQLAPFKAQISFYPTVTIGENQTSFLTFDQIQIRHRNFAWALGYDSSSLDITDLDCIVESVNTQEEFIFEDITLNNSLYDLGTGTALINPSLVIANQMTKLGNNVIKYSITKSGKEVFSFYTIVNAQDRLFIEVKGPTSAIIPGTQVILDIMVFDSAGTEIEDCKVNATIITKQKTIITELNPINKDILINRTQTFSDIRIKLVATKSQFTPDFYNTTIRIKRLTHIEEIINYLTADSFGSILSIVGVLTTVLYAVNSIVFDRLRRVYRKCPHCGKKSYSKYPACFNCGREVNKSKENINLDN